MRGVPMICFPTEEGVTQGACDIDQGVAVAIIELSLQFSSLVAVSCVHKYVYWTCLKCWSCISSQLIYISLAGIVEVLVEPKVPWDSVGKLLKVELCCKLRCYCSL